MREIVAIQAPSFYDLEPSQNTPDVTYQAPDRYIDYNNEQDWEAAIIKADIILAQLLDKKGCTGSTLGDKMKQIKKEDFHTIDIARKAHKVRNAIAHEGGDVEISLKDAKKCYYSLQKSI